MPSVTLADTTFPLQQVSLDSVHEKNVRHGHLSTLHIWPARRPLAASRAALLAALLPDPGTNASRRQLVEKMGGEMVLADEATENGKAYTVGGVFRWGREDGPVFAELREELREAFEGKAPRVLDPFAGGGAIPLEGMRLGCEVMASDLSPVAWFLLRCSLHYPRLVAGQKRGLPGFALRDRDFVTAFLKARGMKEKALRRELARLGHGGRDAIETVPAALRSRSVVEEGDFAWHLRAWSRLVLMRVRRRLASRYPTYADFEPVEEKGRRRAATAHSPVQTVDSSGRSRVGDEERGDEGNADGSGNGSEEFKRKGRLLEPDEDGSVSVAALNAAFDAKYMQDRTNPRWVAKPVVAYLWARTVRCGDCRTEIPLLKTRWLCRKGKKRVRLAMEANSDGKGVVFNVEVGVPKAGDSAVARREYERQMGGGTMSRTGVTCPTCHAVMPMAELRREGRGGRLGARLTAVVVDGQRGKEYRLPTDEEVRATSATVEEVERLYADVPFGLPDDPTPDEGSLGIRTTRYGFTTWHSLFTNRQLLSLGTIIQEIRRCRSELAEFNYPDEWQEAMVAYLSLVLSKFTGYSSALCMWINSLEAMGQTFSRFALPMLWDFGEVNPLSQRTGGFTAMTEWVARYVERTEAAIAGAPPPKIVCGSAISLPCTEEFDVICTDPPYYDAIPYSDLMDFFHVWLRRVLHGLSPKIDDVFSAPLGPKWDAEANDGELIDDASRFGGDRQASKQNYEDGMFRAFKRFYGALRDNGRLVLVFANKSPDAWETLVSALIRAGFAVTASWPIQTERETRPRSMASAALSASIWIVCRKRPAGTKAGWDEQVLDEMEEKITKRLGDFWVAGIRGPDFVWAATGPALEAFSKHPFVRKANKPNERLTSDEFLRRVRRMVVGFVVNRLLKREDGADDELDDPTTYYLLHRNDFGLEPAPAGACILYALSCDVPDSELTGRLDLLAKGGRSANPDGAEDAAPASGGTIRIKPWHRRKPNDLGEKGRDGQMPPLVDCVHKVMQLWQTGERSKVDAYLERRGLWSHELFARVVQAVIELAGEGTEERALLESIQNHLRQEQSRGVVREGSVASQGTLW